MAIYTKFLFKKMKMQKERMKENKCCIWEVFLKTILKKIGFENYFWKLFCDVL